MKYSEKEYDLWNRDVPKPVTEKPIVINRDQAFYEARVSGMTPKQQRDHMYMFTKKKEGRHYFKHIDTREYMSFPIPPDGEDVVVENGEVLRGYETRMGYFELREMGSGKSEMLKALAGELPYFDCTDEVAYKSPAMWRAVTRLLHEREV